VMSRIVVEYNDGTEQTFEETSRAGGSYCTSMSFRDGWVIIEDAYDNRTAIPSERVKNVKEYPSRGRW
jgi:hypothetical protein